MDQTFMINNLVKFLYNECTFSERERTLSMLRESDEWRKQYAELAEVAEQLSESQLEPSQDCVNKIMNYARLRARESFSCSVPFESSESEK